MINISEVELCCIKTINNELIKFTNGDQQKIADFCLKTSLYRKLHTLFTEPELLAITQQVFTDLIIRDFVLDLTDKLSINLNLGKGSGYEFERYLSSSIGHYDTKSDASPDKTLIPSKILNNICIFTDDIEDVLISNRWLITIVVINLYFFNTDFFTEAAPSNPKQ